MQHFFRRLDGKLMQYDFLSGFSEGFAAVKLNGKWGFIDTDGNEICPIKYECPFIPQFSEGYAGVGIPDGNFLKFGYINAKGEEVCRFEYTNISKFKNGIAIVEDDKKWSVINKEFETIQL